MGAESLIFIESWESIGIRQPPGVSTKKTPCPECSHTRKKKNDPCLSINFNKGVANCHNCNAAFVIKTDDQEYEKKNKTYAVPKFEKLNLSVRTLEFFKSRGINERSLKHFNISEAEEWMYEIAEDKERGIPHVKAGKTTCIAFNYYWKGNHINTKFRASLKRFKLVKDAQLIYYGIDGVVSSDEVCIQEGEIDTISAWQCGILNSISVPNGASKGNSRLEYHDNCIDVFENKKKIILALDGDSAGRALRDELIRRLGAERCWIVEYPEGCKDTNEVFLKYGEAEVRRIYNEAKQVPLEGVFTGEDVAERVLDIYDNGFPKTLKVGYFDFDKLWSLRGGELTTVTGIPGHGKSTFLDQILVRLAARFGTRTGIFSPEHDIALHTHKLISKLMGQPSVVGKDRLDREKVELGLAFVNDHFYFMKYDEMNTTIEGILGKARELVIRKGINALVIDPYNCIEHKIPHGYSETQYISELLTKITSFAKINGIHIFLVAHPTKIEKDKKTGKYEVPTLYKISGSANFFNKTDNGFTVYRDDDTNEIFVYVQKIKFDFVGEKGAAQFYYDRTTGRYTLPGVAYENEYNNYLKRINSGKQESLFFDEPAPQNTREPGQLTNIFSMPINNGFDFKETDHDAPF